MEMSALIEREEEKNQQKCILFLLKRGHKFSVKINLAKTTEGNVRRGWGGV